MDVSRDDVYEYGHFRMLLSTYCRNGWLLEGI